MTVTQPNAAGYWPCACCGYHTLPEAPGGTFHYCPVCGWEDDPVQFDDPDYRGGANEPSLREARRNFEMQGRCDNLDYPVRPPAANEHPRFDWSMHGGRGEGREPGPRQVPVSAYAVQLGRDTAVRPFQDVPEGRRLQCVCCGQFILDRIDECDICENCGWEDWYECHDSPAEVIRPNYVSLDQARRMVAEQGPLATRLVNRAGGMAADEAVRLSRAELDAIAARELEPGSGMRQP
jgi:hypothetical protein